MPGKNRTGPLGNGPMTGRGQGLCNQTNNGRGLGCGRGFGRNRISNNKNQKNTLMEERKLLQEKLDMINQQLDNL